jgi:hypothetical protein
MGTETEDRGKGDKTKHTSVTLQMDWCKIAISSAGASMLMRQHSGLRAREVDSLTLFLDTELSTSGF